MRLRCSSPSLAIVPSILLSECGLLSPEQPVYLGVGSEAIMRIKKAYDDNDITIPFPIRTLDFGIKGGMTLSDIIGKNEVLKT